MSRPQITERPAYGHGTGGNHMKTLRGPDGGRDRGTAQSYPYFRQQAGPAQLQRSDGDYAGAQQRDPEVA